MKLILENFNAVPVAYDIIVQDCNEKKKSQILLIISYSCFNVIMSLDLEGGN